MQFLGSNVSILGRIESVIVVLGATCISQCFTTWLKYFFPQLQRITGRFFVRFSLWWFCAALYRFFGNVLSIPTIRTQAEIGEQRDVLFDTGARFVEPIRADMFNQTLANVMFLEGIGKLNHCAFRGYTALRSVMLPNSCREIDNYAFMGCILLNTVRLGNEIKRIGMGAFDGCTSLQEIILPNSVEVIGQQAFNACQQLSKFTGGSDLLVIGNSAFDGTGVRKVDLSQCHNLCQGEPAAQWRSEEEKQEYVARNRLTTHAQQARFLKRIYTNPPNNCYVQFPNDVNFRYRNAKWHVALRRQ
jgi:hypothetical protein